MRAGKNTFTIFAALLVVLVLFCMTRSEGFANTVTKKVTIPKFLGTQPGMVTQL